MYKNLIIILFIFFTCCSIYNYDPTNLNKFQGPIKLNTDVDTFRNTGESISIIYIGPVRPGTDIEKFRETGKTVNIY